MAFQFNRAFCQRRMQRIFTVVMSHRRHYDDNAKIILFAHWHAAQRAIRANDPAQLDEISVATPLDILANGLYRILRWHRYSEFI